MSDAPSYRYGEHERFSWLFADPDAVGDPNKTAAMLAMLILAVWWLARAARIRNGGQSFAPAHAIGWVGWAGFLVALIGFAVGGWFLVHTFSRGGILAALVGGLVLASASFPREGTGEGSRFLQGSTPWRMTLVSIVLALLTLEAVRIGFFSRAADAFDPGADRSVGNRLEIWKRVPQMMRDAPGGWGLGRSGSAYEQWYQPDSTRLSYRTLVNGHLTWLTELGWMGRILYMLGWGLVATVCWPWAAKRPKRRDQGKHKTPRWGSSDPVALSVWVAFGTALCFSSLTHVRGHGIEPSIWSGQEWLLWLPPMGALVVALVIHRWRRKQGWPTARSWTPVAGALGLLALLYLSPAPQTETEVESLAPGIVALQSRTPVTGSSQGRSSAKRICLLAEPDGEICGDHYGFAVRSRVARLPQERWIVLERIADLSGLRRQPVDLLVLSGGPTVEEETLATRLAPSQIMVLNSQTPPPVNRFFFSRQQALKLFLFGSKRKDSLSRLYQQQTDDDPMVHLLEAKGSQTFLRDWDDLIPATPPTTESP